jgi:hypothetical protein
MSTSRQRLQAIIADLDNINLRVQWVPRMFTLELQQQQVDVSQELLPHYENESVEFLNNIFRGDDS